MPNDCYNMIKVTGDPRELKRFDEQFKKSHEVYSGYDTTIKIGKPMEIKPFDSSEMKDVKIKISKPLYNPDGDTFDLSVAYNKETINDKVVRMINDLDLDSIKDKVAEIIAEKVIEMLNNKE